jgi:serine/threonine protein kinase/tetratricopeptide (TPR) repeat protein
MIPEQPLPPRVFQSELEREANGIFERALRVPESRRESFVNSECGGDSQLRDCVIRLISAFRHASTDLREHISTPGLTHSLASEFKGTSRFTLQRRLGTGAFGTVFQVWDNAQRTVVALKLLKSWYPESLFRFKREFRSLVEIRHTNLIQLYELFAEDSFWFFTMELIQGVSFLEFLRPRACKGDWETVRSALAELVAGVHALHLAQRIHRDLKPANVLITHEGRTVVLDFGLVHEFGNSPLASSFHLAGTPAYMSPEQRQHRTLTQASDWYSVGVMLFQVLTGVLPLSQPELDSQSAVPRDFDSSIPDDLNNLCLNLLSISPEQRCDPTQLIQPPQGADLKPSLTPGLNQPARDLFVGRNAELSELDAVFAETQNGTLSVVLIEGTSGIGKTALIRRFLQNLAARCPNLLALTGKCYEFESVPYKGVDSLIDHLSVFLQRLDDSEIQRLLPRDAYLLPRLFPVLGRVPAIAEAPGRAIVPDEQELRQRIFASLRELIARIADRSPVILWVDDLQWADRDSSNFLAELCIPPQLPPVLILLSYRSEEIQNNSALQYLGSLMASRNGNVGNWRNIRLPHLSAEDSRILLTRLMAPEVDLNPVDQLLRESGGHPLFIRELARFAESWQGCAGSAQDLKLRDLLQDRIRRLSPHARELVELTALALQPLPFSALAEAFENPGQQDPTRLLQTLVRENLLRTSLTAGVRKVEPFHDQVRSAAVELMTAANQQRRHAQLANALSLQPGIEPQALVTHYKESGDLQPAYDSAMKAAETAERQLAFDRAAVFFEAAVDLDTVRGADRYMLYRRLADALSKAGRGRDSAAAYMNAFELAPVGEAPELQRLAAEQLMRSGYVDEAMRLFTDLLHKVRVHVPRTPAEATRLMALARIRTRMLLLKGLPVPLDTAVDRPRLFQLDVLRTGALILNTAEPVLATYLQVCYVHKALVVREPSHLAIALALESTIRKSTGTGTLRACQLLEDTAEQIAARATHPNVQGVIQLCRVYSNFLLARIPEGTRESQSTIDFLRTKCSGVAWELTTTYTLLFWFECWAGNVRQVRDLLPQLLKEGAARGDVNVEASLRLISSVHYVYLSQNEPERFLAECTQALARWSSTGFYLQHYGALYTQAETHLYLGEYRKAREILLSSWQAMRRSFILRWEILQVMIFFLRARVTLACWLENRSDRALRREVEFFARRLSRSFLAWCAPMATLLRAGIAAGSGRGREAIPLLDEAQMGFEKVPLHAFAAATAYTSGNLKGGARGDAQKRTAYQFVEQQEVRNPEAFLRMLVPGNWAP